MATSSEGVPPGLWIPWCSSNPNICSISTQIFPVYQGAHQKYFSATASVCPREIPSGDLFRYSTRGGFDHRGTLHQPCCPSNDAWVVYHKPMCPQLVGRWLLLSLWSSIQCSPRCSWSSIRCNIILRCVCRDLMNSGFMIRLSMNIIWVFSGLFYAWLIYLCVSLWIIDLVWPTRLVFLAMGEVLCDGFNPALIYILVTERDKTRICIVAIKGKTMGFLHIYLSLLCLHHVILLMALFHYLWT